jgi:hypothetical protein
MPRLAARRPHHHHHTVVQETRRDKAGFAAPAAMGRARGVQGGKNLGGAGEIKASFLQGRDALGLGPGDGDTK